MVTRKDITSKNQFTEATRTKTYETGLILPIAYGVNDATGECKTGKSSTNSKCIIRLFKRWEQQGEELLTLLGNNEVKLIIWKFLILPKPETYKRVDSSNQEQLRII